MAASVLADNTVEDQHRRAISVSFDYIPNLSNSLPARVKLRNPRREWGFDMEMRRVSQPIWRSAGADILETQFGRECAHGMTPEKMNNSDRPGDQHHDGKDPKELY